MRACVNAWARASACVRGGVCAIERAVDSPGEVKRGGGGGGGSGGGGGG